MTTMNTAASHPQSRPYGFLGETSDPNELGPRGSPLMTPLRPRLAPTPSPPPYIPRALFSLGVGNKILVASLDGGRDPDKARVAGDQALPSDDDSQKDDSGLDGSTDNAAAAAMTDSSLKSLAIEALAIANCSRSSGPSSSLILDHNISPESPLSNQRLSIREEIKHHPECHPLAVCTPSEELAPLRIDSPRSEIHSPVLPSISSTLGDIPRLSTKPMAHMTQDLDSCNRLSIDYCSSAADEPPNSSRSVSTPATSATLAAVTDRMSIDGITNPQTSPFVCSVSGCTAPAFQTRYLLDSHANVHSSARPHYCSVQGCPRSEGGKGFKRKNEMIRHGLVHDSPGYVCPFCPDREHKYPRPDNLQRHVRVHHVDKDKDDPALREVLAQRPDGPNRGRRRRGPP